MQELTLEALQRTFSRWKEYKYKYFAVKIRFAETLEPEVIINSIENADYKLEYLK